MKKSLHQTRYSRLLGMYNKLNERLTRNFELGRFRLFSKQQQFKLLSRIEKLKFKLTREAKLAGTALILGASLWSTNVSAQNTTGVTEFKVNTYTTDTQRFPQVASNAQGGFVVTWQNASEGDPAAQLYNALGEAVGPEFTPNTFTTNQQGAPSVAMDSDGDFVITWQSSYAPTDSYDGVFAQRYNASGVAQGGEFRVNTTTSSNQRDPKVAMNDNGDFVIVWTGFGTGDNDGVYAQRFKADGTTLGSEFLVNEYTSGAQETPKVAMDNSGDFVVTFRWNDEIHARTFNADGTAKSGQFMVNTSTGGYIRNPDIASDDNGDFVIAWQRFDSGVYNVYAQRYSASGAIGSEFVVNDNGANTINPSVAMDSDGDFTIAFNSGDEVNAKRFDMSGIVIGTQFRVNTETGSIQQGASVTMLSPDEFIIAWESNGNADESGYGIFAQRYGNTAPTGTSQQFYIDENSSTGSVVGTVMASDSDDDVLSYTINSTDFNINAATGEITSAIELDFEVTSSYPLEVTVTDNGTPNKSVIISVTIGINDINEYDPSFVDQAYAVNENAPNGTVINSLSATDDDVNQTVTFTVLSGNEDGKFSVDAADGEITVTGALDFETKASYVLEVKATDNGDPTRSTTANVTINVNNLIEAGTRSSTTLSTVNLYPNPANGQVTIEHEGEVTIRISDLSGKLIKQVLMNDTTLNISDLQSGVYTMEISQGENKTVRKLIVE